jgi:hypothetical protein
MPFDDFILKGTGSWYINAAAGTRVYEYPFDLGSGAQFFDQLNEKPFFFFKVNLDYIHKNCSQ